MDRERGGRRYDDGEVVRYGAGESWRPTPRAGAPSSNSGDRSPRKPRSPIRDRDRSPLPREIPRPRSPRPRSPRPRSPRGGPNVGGGPRGSPRGAGGVGIGGPRASPRPRSRVRSPRPDSRRPRSPPLPSSDSYVPGGRFTPRRRSRSPPERFPMRRDAGRSRERGEIGERRPRRRTPDRFDSRNRSPPRGDRFDHRNRSPPLRRDDRFERPRSPRRDWGNRDRDARDMIRRDGPSMDDRRDDRRDDVRRRSRSPFPLRERRDRSPLGRSPARGPGSAANAANAPFRPRSRSPARRPPPGQPNKPNDTHQSYRRSSPGGPSREVNVPSAVNSQPASGRTSPRVASSRARSPVAIPPAGSSPSSRAADQAIKSPPRGPSALRAPPTGPAASRTFTNASQPGPDAPASSSSASGTLPPSGPRGYVPPSRGSFSRGNSSTNIASTNNSSSRGGWGNAPPSLSRHTSSHMPQSPSTAPSTAAAAIPTGPRNSSVSHTAPSTPSAAAAPAIPTGPRNSSSNAPNATASSALAPATPSSSAPQQPVAQALIASLPYLHPGGRLDPITHPLITLGVNRELEQHTRKLREEEEKLREELRRKQDSLRRNMAVWQKGEREVKAWELRSELSERSVLTLAGDGMGGAAF